MCYMVFVGTNVLVVDNSGALRARCIRIYSNSKKAKLGDTILVSLKKVKPNCKLKKGQVFKCILVRSHSFSSYYGGHMVSCDTNSVVLLKKNNDILGTRFKGPIFYKITDFSSLKPLSLTSFVY